MSPVRLLASRVTSPVASVPSGGWLCLRPRPLAGRCHVGSGLAVAGRAGQGLWWALDPRPDRGINILSCRRLCLLGPSPGAVAARQVLGGGGDQATAQSLPSGQTGHSLAAPSHPLSGWGRGGDPHPGFPGATSEIQTHTFPLGFPGSGRDQQRGDKGGWARRQQRGVGRNEGEAKRSSWGGELLQKGMGKQRLRGRERQGERRRGQSSS